MTIKTMTRIFEFQGIRLPDPNSAMTVEQVRGVFVTQYPEIATASLPLSAITILRSGQDKTCGSIHSPEESSENTKVQPSKPNRDRSDSLVTRELASGLARE